MAIEGLPDVDGNGWGTVPTHGLAVDHCFAWIHTRVCKPNIKQYAPTRITTIARMMAFRAPPLSSSSSFIRASSSMARERLFYAVSRHNAAGFEAFRLVQAIRRR